ncbi:MAG TPA: AzlD domain-containing protein [Acidimicrobiales bacterium]|jgi:branched-subunit amino acid transport protein|nr:AzlD domain-containing protein [Acidimicrobiales bacterium]
MTWVVILAVGLGSYAFRVGPQLLFERTSLSPRGDQLVRHAGTAALTALIVLSTKQSASGNAPVPTVLAVAVAAVLAARGGSMLRLLLCGGAVYALSTVIIGLAAS